MWALSLTLLTLAVSINLPLQSGQQLCFNVIGGQQYKIEYVISGVNETNVILKVMHGSQLILYHTNQSEYQHTINLPEGQNSICFASDDNTYKQLSVDFFPTTNPLKHIVTNKDLSLVHRELTTLYEGLEERYRNQQFQSERDLVHRTVLEQTEEKIKWMGIFKIVMLLASALIQLWIMKGFLKDRNLPYQPVS